MTLMTFTLVFLTTDFLKKSLIFSFVKFSPGFEMIDKNQS